MPTTPIVHQDTYDSILSTTLRNYAPKLEDVVFSKRPLLKWLKDGNRFGSKDGGAAITIPIIYGMNDTVGSYSMYDTISTAPQDGITAAQYDWAQLAASITISELEVAMNSGEEQVINLLEAKIMQAEESISETLDYQFFQDGSGNSGKDFLGLKAIVSATDSAYGSAALGGIAAASTTTRADASSFSYWQSNADALGGSLTLAALKSNYNGCSAGTNDFPDFALTTQTLYEAYEALLQPQLRFTNSKQAEAGFQNLLFEGSTVFWDAYCTSGYWYNLNSKYLKLETLKGKWMQTTPFMRPPNQDIKVAQIISYGQLTTNCRFKHGVITGATA